MKAKRNELARKLTLYATGAPKVLNGIGIGLVMVGVANSDSARISFLGSIERELAQKLGRGQDVSPFQAY